MSMIAAPDRASTPRASRLTSVGTKLAGSTIVLIVAVTAGVYLTLSRSQRENLLQSKETSASAVTRLFVDSCAAGVVFGDEAAIADELTTLGRNDDVDYAAVWSTDSGGRITKRFGELRRRDSVEPITQAPSTTHHVREPTRVVLWSPILDRQGGTAGATVVAFSLARENRAIAAIERTTLLVSTAVACGLVVLLVIMARVMVVGPLGKLVGAAQELEHGGKGEVDIRTKDEVGQLAVAFRQMALAIRVREQRIGARNRDMRLVLDNVGQGFVTLDAAGTMSDERSRVIDEWFGAANRGTKLWDYLARVDSSVAQWFEIGWAAIADDVLPLSLCLDQLPKLVHKDGRAYELAYRPILEDERLAKLIVVITEVTARIERERAEQAQWEMMSVFRRVLSDRAALDDFFAETTKLVRIITSAPGGDDLDLRRQIHTVKGNTALFGIQSVATFCHQLEEKLAEAPSGVDPLSRADRDALASLWERAVAMHAQLTEGGTSGRVELEGGEYEAFVGQLRVRTAHEALLATAVTWRFEPVSRRLAVISDQIRALAERLGRAPVDVICEPTTLRLPPAKWGRFWSAFAHVVRNTVDHGVETVAAREAAGKPPRAIVNLSVRRDGSGVVVSIGDDGPGVDWGVIGARARERGLPHATQADLDAALFSEGISSRRESTVVSGRGVGLGALRDVVRELGGGSTIENGEAGGALFRFVLPEAMLQDDGAPTPGESRRAIAAGAVARAGARDSGGS
jgi:two-component system chemotaxis sensor kinase CheA